MDFLFGRKTFEQKVRDSKRVVTRGMRDLDREVKEFERHITQQTAQIKKAAQAGEMGAAKSHAKQLVKTRKRIQQFTNMRASLQALGYQLDTMKATHTMSEAMKKTTQLMNRMNSNMKLPELQKLMMEFEKQTDMTEMKQEMISDNLDDALGTDEEETDEVVNKVLSELGIDANSKLDAIPEADRGMTTGPSTNRVPAMAADGVGGPSEGGINEDDLEARLNRLRRG